MACCFSLLLPLAAIGGEIRGTRVSQGIAVGFLRRVRGSRVAGAIIRARETAALPNSQLLPAHRDCLKHVLTILHNAHRETPTKREAVLS